MAHRDTDASAPRWTPKRPEEILDVTVCDPACGSGTFPLAALRFLTDALYAALQHHHRIEPDGARSLVRLLGIRDEAGRPEERLGDELIPCRPDDADFEPRLKAVLRRHVVERCIYAVDVDPLAVELCRLSLWIETMDRELPFGFLDHKIKCGNALIGAWFDQFQHYPVMAWKNREGGDKNHSNGVHFAKGARTKAIKTFLKERLTPDLKLFLSGRTLFQEDLLAQAATAHDEALGVLADMHALPVQDAAERARRYRDHVVGSSAWRSLKKAMDLWCACWFWPVDRIDCAPLPTTFTAPPPETRAVASRIAAELRFFHWELEFPDVFRTAGSGFDAILGNPPWDIAKPVSMEFFSNIDPLYRSYGKQEAVRRQSRYFDAETVEREWLDYNARFRAQSNFTSHAGSPFGDPEDNTRSQDRFIVSRGHENRELHARWRRERRRAAVFADPSHPFRHQGSADLNLYKLFLEAVHALLRPVGRLGFVVPSGLYSDNGTGPLRRLFLDHCRWEWLFGIENRDKVFPIDSRFKFNPIIVEKGGTTEAIRTGFMRRSLDDWDRAEDLATPYLRSQVDQFSPKSRAILEIQSRRDLEILEKIYANSVLLGDDGPDGWGIRYATEFHMTNDSRLFPPRPQWEAKGYRPDEYSRWILGDWRPIEELWAELRTDPSRPQPAEVELEDWLFDTTASPERRTAEACFVHGHLLKPGDVARTAWRTRCAQPPYDRLPIPRADIPAGVILSRDGDSWIREETVDDTALPLYEGRMIGQFDYSQKGWVSGKGRGAVWREIPWERKQIEPQYLMRSVDYEATVDPPRGPKAAHMQVCSSTNKRTAICSFVCGMPASHKAPVFYSPDQQTVLALTGVMNSLTFDFVTRMRLIGLGLDYHVLEQCALPLFSSSYTRGHVVEITARLNLAATWSAPQRLQLCSANPQPRSVSGLTDAERTRLLCILNALIATTYRLDREDLYDLLRSCDLPSAMLRDRTQSANLDPKGFWRVDRDQNPELRHTVLTLVAFHDLESKVEAASGDLDLGIEAFLAQNDGEGWTLPETLCLADYDLGHDDRARHPQVVAARLGPRFYDWQLTQWRDDAVRGCHLHARNLFGADGYSLLLRETHRRRHKEPNAPDTAESLPSVAEHGPDYRATSPTHGRQRELFETETATPHNRNKPASCRDFSDTERTKWQTK